MQLFAARVAELDVAAVEARAVADDERRRSQPAWIVERPWRPDDREHERVVQVVEVRAHGLLLRRRLGGLRRLFGPLAAAVGARGARRVDHHLSRAVAGVRKVGSDVSMSGRILDPVERGVVVQERRDLGSLAASMQLEDAAHGAVGDVARRGQRAVDVQLVQSRLCVPQRVAAPPRNLRRVQHAQHLAAVRRQHAHAVAPGVQDAFDRGRVVAGQLCGVALEQVAADVFARRDEHGRKGHRAKHVPRLGDREKVGCCRGVRIVKPETEFDMHVDLPLAAGSRA
mmetsp:Transcript_16675/g.56339  ORF Transcript_16675/g.56339 Transcript_16675/m.56339 type:complete len:284 (-) Transcript_16675:104-955(-)